ncbi:class I SAM-dependent methyltransferase [Lutibacter aestuarii]|uniref:Class I SAM-dependent methyltransferase n=1 Tax=Lutibacter aestuarii TaxID=861111 RepID=A0ABW2Z829_9FLAO
MKELINIINNTTNRFQFWNEFLTSKELRVVAELGVYKGDFSKYILENENAIEKYFMLDPWRNLEDWNKPANTNNLEFEKFYQETMQKTNFASEKRIVLRGKTTEVIDKIEDKSLDFMYIDGDHTLKGITIDLNTSWNKIKKTGFIGGDDFCPSIWQHNESFEPTLIFPYAIYFAEAMNVKIFALPFNQFLIDKSQKGFEFINLSGKDYNKHNLLEQLKVNFNQPTKKSKYNFITRFFK